MGKARAALPLIAMLVSVAGTACAGVLDQVKTDGTLRIGFREDASPLSFKTADGTPTGYSVELCEGVAADIRSYLKLPELRLVYVPVTAETRFDAVEGGQVDLLCESTTATLGRREKVSFSLPTYATGVAALMRADASDYMKDILAGERPKLPARSMVSEALRGKKFGVRSGTTAETWLREAAGRLAAEAEIQTFDSYTDGLRQLQEGDIDAFFGDRVLLVDLVARSSTPNAFVIGDRHFTYEPYALALPRDDEDFRLAVDRGLSHIYRSGAIEPLFTKYFGRPDEVVRTLFLLQALPE